MPSYLLPPLRACPAAAGDYPSIRENVYGPLRNSGAFTWDYMHGEEYALASVLLISPELRDAVAEATAGLGRVYRRAAAILRHADDELLLGLGIPEAALGTARLAFGPADDDVLSPTMIGRFDFVIGADGIRMLEFNSDTPTGIVEAFMVNGQVCGAYGLADPNAGCASDLRRAFSRAAEACRAEGRPIERIVFSALGWHDEDASTVRYLLAQSGLPGRFVPLEELRLRKDGLWPADGTDGPVQLWYRLHALEKLAEDRDDDGYPVGAELLARIAAGELAILNPPCGFLVQSKAVQALIWAMHEAGEVFTPDEHSVIERHMLPTYFEDRFSGKGIPFVSKPVFGREGGGVALYKGSGELWERDSEEWYADQPCVYQQLIELPELTVDTIAGPYAGRLLWGSFLIGGRPSAQLARVGERITGNLSCYVPIALA